MSAGRDVQHHDSVGTLPDYASAEVPVGARPGVGPDHQDVHRLGIDRRPRLALQVGKHIDAPDAVPLGAKAYVGRQRAPGEHDGRDNSNGAEHASAGGSLWSGSGAAPAQRPADTTQDRITQATRRVLVSLLRRQVRLRAHCGIRRHA